MSGDSDATFVGSYAPSVNANLNTLALIAKYSIGGKKYTGKRHRHTAFLVDVGGRLLHENCEDLFSKRLRLIQAEK